MNTKVPPENSPELRFIWKALHLGLIKESLEGKGIPIENVIITLPENEMVNDEVLNYLISLTPHMPGISLTLSGNILFPGIWGIVPSPKDYGSTSYS